MYVLVLRGSARWKGKDHLGAGEALEGGGGALLIGVALAQEVPQVRILWRRGGGHDGRREGRRVEIDTGASRGGDREHGWVGDSKKTNQRDWVRGIEDPVGSRGVIHRNRPFDKGKQ